MKPHYLRIRKVKTHSGSTAIQVGSYEGKRFEVRKHIGSSKDPTKITELVDIAYEYIRSHNPQLEIDFNSKSEEVLFKRGIRITGSILQEAYEYLERVYCKIGFDKIDSLILKHFAFIRILEPASKLKSIKLLEKYFDIKYKKTTAFRELLKILRLKDDIESIAIKYARKHLGFDFSLVFYDVTTLYFETHSSDDFRKEGFSKDNKINQPQILIGVVVNEVGFPIYYDIFKGNTFEGKTIIPVILKLKEKYQISKFTVIADAGMLSEENLSELREQGVDYVVGARIGNLCIEEVRVIANELGKIDKKVIRREDILFEYSSKRAKKDKSDNDRQLKKAEYYLNNPSKIIRRSKFLSNIGKKTFKLNESIIEKHRLLEGIKGYKTNIVDLREELLIARYKDLWKIEQLFRIAKTDLEIRPIYHRRKNAIECHILIVFVALCMGKVIELETGESIRKVMDELKDKWTVTLKDEISGNSLKITLDKKPH
ncbi:MAG: IS1634 family transposase [Patescibacteria group bacterium]